MTLLYIERPDSLPNLGDVLYLVALVEVEQFHHEVHDGLGFETVGVQVTLL